LLALASSAVVLADARSAALLAPASSAVVLADARPAALLALVSFAVVLADPRPATLLAPASLAVVLADFRPAALLAAASSAVVLADARSTVLLAVCYADSRALYALYLQSSFIFGDFARFIFAVVRDLSGIYLQSFSSGPCPAPTFPLLLLPCRLAPPSIARLANATFLAHFLISMPDPALKLSRPSTSL
jgi:hypothetical protein